MAEETQVTVPDIGGATNVDVIDILVQAGDTIEKEQSLITLEGDKATMDIPAPFSGEVTKIALKVGDKVSQGALILTMKPSVETVAKADEKEEPKKEAETVQEPKQIASKPEAVSEPTKSEEPTQTADLISAGPAVRRLARDLGVHLHEVFGSGRKSRITIEDVQAYVKKRLNTPSSQPANYEMPIIDFSKFGDIETKPLNKIKRITGINMQRAWNTVPHVTQFDEADITELEAFRKSEAEHAQKNGYKLTLLAFVTKVVCQALQAFPQFNASLDASSEALIYKKYFNIGIAVETPQGLVVPVIKNVQQLSVSAIAREMASLSQKAREKGLSPADMAGGCFTISSLGGIGGTAFTPIVNAPEVAILGLSKSFMKPVYQDGVFQPRLMLPLSLSYDHRVIDGAEAVRFTSFLVQHLQDIRKILL